MSIFRLVYEGETETPKVETPVVENHDLPESLKGKTTFTQAELNHILSEEKKKSKTTTEKQIKELETLKKSQTLSENDKKNLEARIDEMKNTLLTKEEIARKEKERLETTYKEQLTKVTQERDTWQNRYTQSTIDGEIVNQASTAEAFSPEDLKALLGPNTRIVELNDEEGKGTNKFVPKVKFNDLDAEGKPITLDMTVEQAVKRMKELPRYGHLFKSTAAGGLGGKETQTAGSVDTSKMTHEQWLEHRKKKGLGKR